MSVARPLGRPGLGSLLSLPPALRQSLYRQQNLQLRHSVFQNQNGARHLSFAAISSSMDASAVVALFPATAMESLHMIGVPWYAVFPVSAILIRSFLVYPLFQRPLRRYQAERIALQPLIDANMSLTKRKLAGDHLSPNAFRINMLVRRWNYIQEFKNKVFGQPRISLKRGLSFFTLIAVSESIRRLSGHKEGLLKLLLGPFDWLASWIVPSRVEAALKEPVIQAPVQQLPPDLASALGSTATSLQSQTPDWKAPNEGIETNAAGQTLREPAEQAVQAATSSGNLAIDSPWFEPSLLTEGFSWCPDLTASDPTLVLPFLFTSSFFASIYFSPRIGGEKGGKATNMQRIGMTIAMLSIIPALKMPVALLLYFITNIWVSAVQTRWLAYSVPIRSVPLACKRPVRTQPMKELADGDATELSARKRR